MRVTLCECPEPGWCARHECNKSYMDWQFCRRRPEYFELWEQGIEQQRGGQSHVMPQQAAPCRHRGKMVRSEVCPSCRLGVRLKVFSCAVHGECTLQRSWGSIPICLTCPSFEAVPESSENSVIPLSIASHVQTDR